MTLVLRILAGRHVGKELRIDRRDFVIGRDEGCHLRPTSSEVSRRHCEIRIDEAGVPTIRDCGSTNGTFVNGRRVVQATELVSGDVVIVGPLMFEVALPQNPSEFGESAGWSIIEPEQVDFHSGEDRKARPKRRTYVMHRRDLIDTADSASGSGFLLDSQAVVPPLADELWSVIRRELDSADAPSIAEVETILEIILDRLRRSETTR
jgi:hypothetical protein